jgi:hypothetical protein
MRRVEMLSGSLLMVLALIGLSLFLNVFASVANEVVIWLAVVLIVLTFILGFLLVLPIKTHIRRIAEIVTLFIVWSLIIPLPLPLGEGDKGLLVSLWGLLIVACYSVYMKRTQAQPSNKNTASSS